MDERGEGGDSVMIHELFFGEIKPPILGRNGSSFKAGEVNRFGRGWQLFRPGRVEDSRGWFIAIDGSNAFGMAEGAQGFGFHLADAFAAESHFVADFFHSEPGLGEKAFFDDELAGWVEGANDFIDGFEKIQLFQNFIRRALVAVIADEVQGFVFS